MIRWDPPGCAVVFSTREGGVSEGPYASLNLGRMTGDDVERVDENRRLLCAEIGADVRAARAQPAGALDARPPREAGRPRRAGRRPLDGRTGAAGRRDDGRLPADRARARRRRACCRRPPRGLARPAGRDRRCRHGRARRPAAGGDRPGDRPVLLRGRRRGVGAVRRDVRRRCRRRPQARSLDARPSEPSTPPESTTSSAPTSARSATRSASSRTAAPASRAVSRE